MLQKGALQLYNLGQILRERYLRLMPSNGFYSANDMYVSSSVSERCLMSAQSFLAGLLPPPTSDQHKLPLPWQPVAINSMPRNRDRVDKTKYLLSSAN